MYNYRVPIPVNISIKSTVFPSIDIFVLQLDFSSLLRRQDIFSNRIRSSGTVRNQNCIKNSIIASYICVLQKMQLTQIVKVVEELLLREYQIRTLNQETAERLCIKRACFNTCCDYQYSSTLR